MIVQSSNIYMSSEHEKTESVQVTRSMDMESLKSFSMQFEEVRSQALQISSAMFAGANGGMFSTSEEGEVTPSVLVMTDEGMQFRAAEEAEKSIAEQREITRSRLLQSLLEALHPSNRSHMRSPEIQFPQETAQTVPEDYQPNQPIQLKPLALQVNFKVTESIEEYECTNFHSCGLVKTADRREIEFDMALKMERSYSATREYELTEEVIFTDPLIVNFEGNSADLSDEKFEFDLDADGDNELISYLLGESGMLALDRNEDGLINDGTELFGALSGNGFADLAQYDEDGNNYIDEADSIFTELGIWSKTPDAESLVSLADKGIGAIYLGSTDSPFEIKGENNQTNGRVRSSGIYLTEAGGVGTVQQIDMAV
ncbi:hypothetical protein [Neptuniibacter sp.]|uniref:hypothetical protein n=1 Tax=Neptuniibacter sp. TaxID=1962643 RepID=UPI00262489B0|nr:hypothetical protein [Neptuniibacter sp.]MCP4596214.1 hypothetical protein [Neptuniibacter sp.]